MIYQCILAFIEKNAKLPEGQIFDTYFKKSQLYNHIYLKNPDTGDDDKIDWWKLAYATYFPHLARVRFDEWPLEKLYNSIKDGISDKTITEVNNAITVTHNKLYER